MMTDEDKEVMEFSNDIKVEIYNRIVLLLKEKMQLLLYFCFHKK